MFHSMMRSQINGGLAMMLKWPAFSCLLPLLLAGMAYADEPTTDQPDATTAVQKHWLEVSRTYAQSFVLSPTDKIDEKFELTSQPVFRHTQSVRGDDIGAVHLWVTKDKRPAVIGAVFAWSNSNKSRMVSYELHSLTDTQPISLRHRERDVWSSPTPGLEWKEFPVGTDAPVPQPLRQRLQAKQLSRRFTANATSPNKQRWELRFVPTPIYQYGTQDSPITYGAMFAFCQGTDAEAIVIIEAVQQKQESGEAKLAWRYALVPFTDYKVRINLDDSEVWESPPGTMNEDGKPHYWTVFEQVDKPDFEINKK